MGAGATRLLAFEGLDVGDVLRSTRGAFVLDERASADHGDRTVIDIEAFTIRDRFSEGDAKAYAEQLVDDQGGLEHLDRQTLENHFDWDSYVTELETGGGITEFEFAGTTYTADPNSV